MSPKLFLACLLPFVCAAVYCLAGWVRMEGLELPAGIAACIGAIPFLLGRGC